MGNRESITQVFVFYCEKKFCDSFYLPSQITDIRPKAEKFISHESPCNFDELRAEENTLLLTRSGTVGAITYVSKTLAGKIMSDDVIRVSFKNDYDAGYIYAWLKSSVGQQILLTNSCGAVIEHIEPEHLEELPLPVAPESFKRQIHELIVCSYELRDESNELIDKAEKILIEELHLPDIYDFEYEKVFSVKLSDLRGRLDASYHTPLIGKDYRAFESARRRSNDHCRQPN